MPRRIQGDHREFIDVIEGKVRKELKRLRNNGQIVGMRPKGGRFTISAPTIDMPHIVCGDNGDGVGRGPFKKGDVVKRAPKKGNGEGEGEDGEGEAGDEHAEGIQVSIDAAEMFQWLGEDLELPEMKKKPVDTFEDIKYVYNDISKIGPRSLRHPRRTLLEALKRMSMTGELDNLHMLPGCTEPMRLITPINSDQRYRQYKEVKIPSSNAVIFFARDCSGSMDDHRCEVVSDIAWWIDGWIRRFYEKVERCYLVHDTESMEVDEKKFYRYRQGGGTTCSSAFKHITELMENRFPPQKFNIYIFYFTDGDNSSSDNGKLLDTLKAFNPSDINMIGITQINPWNTSENLFKNLKNNWKSSTGTDDFLKLQDLNCSASNKTERNKEVLKGIRFLLGSKNVTE